MAYPVYPYPGYQPGFYPTQPVPDQLAQLRMQQQNQQMMQGPQTATQNFSQPQHPDAGGIIWVQGDAGAKAYMVAPGNTVPLWDSENQVIYLKSVDTSGMPSMRILDYTERTAARPAPQQQGPQLDISQVVTWDKLDEYLSERLKRPVKATKQKEDAENG